MTSTRVTNENATRAVTPATTAEKLEVVTIPVADVGSATARPR